MEAGVQSEVTGLPYHYVDDENKRQLLACWTASSNSCPHPYCVQNEKAKNISGRNCFEEHWFVYHMANQLRYNCAHCERVYKYRRDYRRHMHQSHKVSKDSAIELSRSIFNEWEKKSLEYKVEGNSSAGLGSSSSNAVLSLQGSCKKRTRKMPVTSTDITTYKCGQSDNIVLLPGSEVERSLESAEEREVCKNKESQNDHTREGNFNPERKESMDGSNSCKNHTFRELFVVLTDISSKYKLSGNIASLPESEQDMICAETTYKKVIEHGKSPRYQSSQGNCVEAEEIVEIIDVENCESPDVSLNENLTDVLDGDDIVPTVKTSVIKSESLKKNDRKRTIGSISLMQRKKKKINEGGDSLSQPFFNASETPPPSGTELSFQTCHNCKEKERKVEQLTVELLQARNMVAQQKEEISRLCEENEELGAHLLSKQNVKVERKCTISLSESKIELLREVLKDVTEVSDSSD